MLARFMRAYNRNKLRRVLPYLDGCASVADVGCGSAYLSSLLSEQGFDVTALDVVDVSRTEVEPVLFDGAHIPYPDDAFDAAILVFVLHHSTDQLALLKEVFRVTGKRLVILEDSPANRLEWRLNAFFDKLWNGMQDIAAPLFFQSAAFWRDEIRRLGGRIVESRTVRQVTGAWTFRYTLFVVDTPRATAASADSPADTRA